MEIICGFWQGEKIGLMLEMNGWWKAPPVFKDGKVTLTFKKEGEKNIVMIIA